MAGPYARDYLALDVANDGREHALQRSDGQRTALQTAPADPAGQSENTAPFQ